MKTFFKLKNIKHMTIRTILRKDLLICMKSQVFLFFLYMTKLNMLRVAYDGGLLCLFHLTHEYKHHMQILLRQNLKGLRKRMFDERD